MNALIDAIDEASTEDDDASVTAGDAEGEAAAAEHLYEPLSVRAVAERLSDLWTHGSEIFSEVTSEDALVAAGGWVRKVETDGGAEPESSELFGSGRAGDALKLQEGDGAKYLSLTHGKKLALQYFRFFKILFKLLLEEIKEAVNGSIQT